VETPVPPSASLSLRPFVIAQTSPVSPVSCIAPGESTMGMGMGIFSRLNLSACVLFVPLSNGFIIRMTANPDPVTMLTYKGEKWHGISMWSWAPPKAALKWLAA